MEQENQQNQQPKTMRHFLLLHLFFFVISVSFLLASFYFDFSGAERWHSGSFPEALKFMLLFSLPVPFVVVTSTVFLSFIKTKSKIPKVLAISITLIAAFSWLSLEAVNVLITGWGYNYNISKELRAFLALVALVSGLLSALFGFLAIYKKH